MEEPLGARSDVINIDTLTRWNLTKLPEFVENVPSVEDAEVKSPFPWRTDINSKIILWSGVSTTLNVDALVHSTNEKFSDKSPESAALYRKAGPDMLADIRKNIKVCKTGEAKLSKGYRLLARYVVHTVGPRYNVRYTTAAESALYSCYRNTMQVIREQDCKSVAIPCLHSNSRGYPAEDGAHIGIRTIRRFLEKYGGDLETVVFVCNEEENMAIYEKMLPLYFPRNSKEEAMAACCLPENIGNENGEPVIAERQIRIMTKPTTASLRASSMDELEETIDLNKEFGTSTVYEVGRHPFAHMEENPDDLKKNSIYGKTTEEQRKLENQRRFERLMKRAKTEDLTEIAALRCLYRTGVDKYGRPVVIFVGKHFPAATVNMDKALLYILRVMEPVVETDYVIVYFHTQTTAVNQPPMTVLRQIYNILDHKYKKNLKAFYIVHPTWWSKLATWFFTTFSAIDIKDRVFNMKGVQYLYGTIYPDQMDIPTFITTHDVQINGPRYYEPKNESVEEL